MPSSRRSRAYQDNDSPIAELTSGQLVIGICVFLFVALTCFLAGVLLGKRDPSFREAAQPGIAEAGINREGVQRSPRPDVLRSGEPAEALDPYTTPEERSGPRVTEVAPPGAPPAAPVRIERVAEAAPEPPERPVTVRTPEPGQEPASAPEPATDAETPAPDREQVAQVTPPPPPPRETTPAEGRPVQLQGSAPPIAPPADPAPTRREPAPEPAAPQAAPPAPAPAAAPAATGGRGAYGIQVASFISTDRASRAEAESQRVRQETGMQTAVYPSPDGSIYRVYIVGYPDKPSATAATQELRRRDGYADAFPQELPR